MLQKNMFLVMVMSVLCLVFSGCDEETSYDLSAPGEFTECSYDTGLQSDAYKSAIVYYPCEKAEGPFPATTFTGGLTNVKEQMRWFAKHAVTYGTILIVMTPTNQFSTTTDTWKTAMLGGLDKLEAENKNPKSPIYNLVDTTRLGIMGFSMGGGGTLKAANAAGSRIKTALSLAPHEEETELDASLYENISVPVLVTTGTSDSLCPPDSVRDIFDTLPTDITRLFVNFTDADHVDWMNMGDQETQVRLGTVAIAWLKCFLEGDASYYPYINGDKHDAQAEAGWFTDYDFIEL